MTAVETALAGGLFARSVCDADFADLRQLVDDVGRGSFDAAVGHRRRPERLDNALWHHLEESGLARLTSTPDQGAGPAELAVVLHGLARHCAAVPVAETDLLGAWFAHTVELAAPADGPLTVAIADGEVCGDRITGGATCVPWVRQASAITLAVRSSDGMHAGIVDASEISIDDGCNLAGEPRNRIAFDLPVDRLRPIVMAVYDELLRRGAWARCVQVIGALDAAAVSAATHCHERVQFGQPLSRLQAVQQSLAVMAGDVERGRAATTLAVAAAADYGFGSTQTDYAVTVAKVVLGRVVSAVVSTAHQLHGAIGVSMEHPLWLSTMRAQSWVGEFGSTGHYARRLGRMALDAADPWNLLRGRV